MRPANWQEAFLMKMARKKKRATKRRELKKQGFVTKADIVDRSKLKKELVKLLGIFDSLVNGKQCRLENECPAYHKIGIHQGELAYHLIPAQRGDAIRFIPENVVWACRAANFGEYHNRSAYRQKHIWLFGAQLIEQLELRALETVKYSNADLLEMRKDLLLEIELLRK